ncbi:MAG: DNA translocase FtsK 4TM domain-containing protein, partial [Clostridia bacterium]|nr:DNA translocase FtsK 4TM domain-containing protein [Clostridia bacterium]
MAQNNSKAKYKVTGKRPAPKKPSGARAGKDAFKKESSGFLKQFLPFILFIVALLLLISFFVEDFGAVGNFIRDKVLFGIFSVSLYFLPALLVAVGVLLLTDNEDKKIAYAVWCSVVGFLLIDVMCHLLFAPDDVVGNFNPFLHFQYGMNKQGGGFIGGFFGGLLTVCFSKIGAYIIVGAVVVILVMVILKKTPKDAAKGIKDALNDRRDRREALRAEEEAKRKRLEREAREIEKEHQLSLAEAQRAAEENPVYDPTAYEGERKTEFDPDILGEDFAKEEFTSANDKEKDEVLEPVAKSGDAAPELDPSILEADDDTVLDMLSKTYLGGDGLKVETSDLDPTLDGGEAVIPSPPEYVFPDIDLLVEDTAKKAKDTKRELEDKEEKLIQFSVVEILNKYKEKHEYQPILAEIEDALLYLSKIEAIKIEGGFLVIYNSMEINRIIMDNKIRYKVDDYRAMDEFYEQRKYQIHIVGEYATMMIKDHDAALQFVQDYFQMDFRKFLTKYFKGERAKEIGLNITPQRYHKIFGELSDIQSKIIQNSDSKYIVVAAGPGSGKTRVLVHKLASLLSLEDVKS